MAVELHGAFCWDCDECGTENFVRAIEGDIDEPALEANENQIDTYLVGTGEVPCKIDGMAACEFLTQRIVLAPPHVTCAKCGYSFEAEVPHAEDDE